MTLKVRPQVTTSASNEIWELLAPAVPDCLEHLGDNFYQASWWKPVPMMDIEIVMRTVGIQILGKPYEPESLSGGRALRFQFLLQA